MRTVRFWSLVFGVISFLTAALFIYAPLDKDWWLPGAISTETPLHFGADVDHLFVLILWITGIVFVGTEAALVYVLWKYPAADGGRAVYAHGSQRLEVVWTIIPSAILVFIALYQMGTWTAIKFRSSKPKVPPTAEVTARQFQWMIRYPGPDGKIGTDDDLHTTNDFHFVKGQPTLIQLKSKDVIHSFFLPRLRIKQDAVPGLTIPVWFDSPEGGTFDLVCAELCGWGHYKMKGIVTVHDTQKDFDEWMRRSLREQNRDQLTAPAQGQLASAASTTGEK